MKDLKKIYSTEQSDTFMCLISATVSRYGINNYEYKYIFEDIHDHRHTHELTTCGYKLPDTYHIPPIRLSFLRALPLMVREIASGSPLNEESAYNLLSISNNLHHDIPLIKKMATLGLSEKHIFEFLKQTHPNPPFVT